MSSPTGAKESTWTISAIVVTFNAGDDLERCIRHLIVQGCPLEVVVVDNGSADGSVERAKASYPEIRVVSEGIDDGFAGGANRGAAAASGDVLVFLNPDMFLEDGSLALLLSTVRNADGAIVCGPLVSDPDQSTRQFGFTIDYWGDPVELSSPLPPLWLNCAFATSRRLFLELGGLDRAFFMFCEDMDFCWRAQLHGYEVKLLTDARVAHRGGASTAGGYIRNDRIEVSASRVALRERNTLSTLIRCGPAAWILLVVPLRILRIMCIALYGLARDRPDLSRGVVDGLMWSARRLPQLISERRAIPVTSAVRWRILWKHMRREIHWLHVLRRYGWPKFVDRTENS